MVESLVNILELAKNRALALNLLSFMDATSDDEDQDRIALRQIREYQFATAQWTRSQRLQSPITEPPLMSHRNWTTLSDTEISKIWRPTSEDAHIGVYCNPEANWRPHMEPYKPSIDVLHTREKVLPLYYENATYPNLDGIPYFRALQKHTHQPESYVEFEHALPQPWMDKNNINIFQRYSLKPVRIPPGFERYVPMLNGFEASGDNNARNDTVRTKGGVEGHKN